MLTLERIELLNWDIQANQLLLLQPGVNLLTGENGSGKTSLLDALKVALGASRIGADRSINDYLRVRDEPVAMVRLVASNRADPATRRRPFDVLGAGLDGDQVSLASVFRAAEEGYERRDYILDGDRSPLAQGVEARAFRRRSDYLSRLERLGLGRSFQTLIARPQGEVASLCRESPERLFDLLFDFIGGKDALDEWERLRQDFLALERRRTEHAAALAASEQRHAELCKRLEVHERFLESRRGAQVHELALPLARRDTLDRAADERSREARALREQAGEADLGHQRAVGQLEARSRSEQALKERVDELRAGRDALRRELDGLQGELLEVGGRLGALELHRRRVVSHPARDLAVLERGAREQNQAIGRLDHALEQAAVRRRTLETELAEIEKGALPPPDDVRRFREVLARAKVPHHLLMDLVEPREPDGPDRAALEGFLGPLRLAVAVPDVPTFARAVALARQVDYPHYVLAPDVRSPAPKEGEHPLLDGIRVKEPRYRGLIVRLLRHVIRLGADDAIEDTHRRPGARVDPRGFVLDRLGGIHRGVDRFYLGRDALERRRRAVITEIGDLDGEATGLRGEREVLATEAKRMEREIAEERDRREWLAREPEHAALTAERQRLAERADEVRDRERGIEAERDEVDGRLRALIREIGVLEEKIATRVIAARELRARAEALEGQSGQLREQQALALDEAAAVSRQLETVGDEVRAGVEVLAADTDPDTIARLLRLHQDQLSGYGAEDRDENLPHNVRTQERQVHDVRGELRRIDDDAERAGQAAEQAHEQYRRITRRVFRHYFARLAAEAQAIRFRIAGELRDRDDGKFTVDVKVGVGDKAPVPYGSASLSGGEKAALSILMAMSTMSGDVDGGPGFFLVDEPFSASDTYKIQELGAFLGRTGAQYLVSMPTSEDIARCGPWLQSVLTATKCAGGRDGEGRLRLAPPFKCSYVERDGE